MEKEKIVIDFLNGLIDYILEHDLDEATKEKLREMDNTISLHFSLGMYIRNHYELSDQSRVPNLLLEFKISWIKDEVERSGCNYKDALDSYEFWYPILTLDDEISDHITKKIWKKVRAE